MPFDPNGAFVKKRFWPLADADFFPAAYVHQLRLLQDESFMSLTGYRMFTMMDGMPKWAVLILACWASLLPTAAVAWQDETPPNIIFIMADDLGFNDVGFNGGTEIKTPNLDGLAKQGAILRALYVQPGCSATRAAFLTGRYPIRYGLQAGNIRPADEFGLAIEEKTIADELNRIGYRTAMIGKWHLGWAKPEYLPLARGFDLQYGMVRADFIDYFKHERRDVGPDWYRQQVPLEEEGYATDLIADEAARVISEHDAANPLFMFVAFNAPHSPLQIPRGDKIPEYANLSKARGRYAQMVTTMDEGIGRILKALDDSDLAEQTIVVFCSDNGGADPGERSDNTPFRGGRGTLYEGGVRACACIRWPGKIAPQVYELPLHIVDWYPTLVAAANLRLTKKDLDGHNRLYQLVGGDAQLESSLLIQARSSGSALRKGDWKLLRWSKADEEVVEELYNLSTDPGEANNLISDAEFSWRADDLRRELLAFERQQVTPLRHLNSDQDDNDDSD